MNNGRIINAGGINGLGIGLIDLNSKDFKELQNAIKNHSVNLVEERRIENGMLSIRFQMEEYLNKDKPERIVPPGEFLKEFVKLLKIKNKTLAGYISYEESNLSAIFNGKRKINVDLALKFGKIFKVDPAIWLHIQSKNELLELELEKEEFYDNFGLEDLLKKAS